MLMALGEDFAGANICFAGPNISFELKAGQIVFFESSLIPHFNTACTRGERHSMVLFSRNEIHHSCIDGNGWNAGGK
jgi:predicted 2-oxoglutarate/Fe(II)-dependent dioxygenase YbiX